MEKQYTVYSKEAGFDLRAFLNILEGSSFTETNGIFQVSFKGIQIKVVSKVRDDDASWLEHLTGFKGFVQSKMIKNEDLKNKILGFIDKIVVSYGITGSYNNETERAAFVEFVASIAISANGVIFMSQGLFDRTFEPLVTTTGESSDKAILP